MTIFTGDLHDNVAQTIAGAENAICGIFKEMATGYDLYKVQNQIYGGNGVHFNVSSETRFSLSSKSKGVMYLATTPHTGLKEFYQDAQFIGTEDLEANCMAVIQATRTIKIIDLAALAPLLKIPVDDLRGAKTVYADTQLLAEVLSQYADGMEYLSRHTGKPCIALWSDSVDGKGMLTSSSGTPLTAYCHNGHSAQTILKSQLNIYVI